MIRPAKELEGYEIAARDGTLGSVKDVYFDDQQWLVRYFVVKTGSWLNGRQVLLSAPQLHAGSVARALSTDATQEQVRNSPPVEADRPVSRQHEQALHDYFGWPYYWTVAPYAGAAVVPMPPSAAAPAASVFTGDVQVPPAVQTRPAVTEPREEHDPHLRSAREVRGYEIAASDGAIGQVEDLLLDDVTWELPYLLVDTRKWLPGRKVILSPQWVQAVRWRESHVAVNLSRDEIKHSPAYDSAAPVDQEYTDRLFAHYGRQRRTGAHLR
jgi:uncharacterized protein YrrD